MADTNLIGYARVSTEGQNLDRQHAQLTEAGCHRIFADKQSGRDRHRPQLEAALDYLREGDTLAVTSLSRLGRSLPDLIRIVNELREAGVEFRSLKEQIDTTTPSGRLTFHVFAAIAEFHRELTVEATKEGVAAARARGKIPGRPRVMTDEKITAARAALASGQSVAAVARSLGVSRGAIYNNMDAINR